MREEMSSNEDVIFNRQNARVVTNRDNPVNLQRRHVTPGWIVLWYLLALVSVCLWLLRLLGVVSLSA